MRGLDMDDAQRKALLAFARAVIRSRLTGGAAPPAPKPAPEPGRCSGAFVTLHKYGELRGCIGCFADNVSAVDTVREMAVAALGDTRFLHKPVTAAELDELDIEISVLSPMERTADPLSLEPGAHGILIRRGGCSGCFLPQVATEQQWTKEQFLSYCCSHKAGLPADAWKDSDTEVFLFTAEVFGEEELGGG
ncbi:MAG TPA: AmmeMemoRadiSam system protein A [Phycisphaerae bacterium]|nr:AmmeMemoRadiSam system protein A [Phycisphaerae bacterium]